MILCRPLIHQRLWNNLADSRYCDRNYTLFPVEYMRQMTVAAAMLYWMTVQVQMTPVNSVMIARKKPDFACWMQQQRMTGLQQRMHRLRWIVQEWMMHHRHWTEEVRRMADSEKKMSAQGKTMPAQKKAGYCYSPENCSSGKKPSYFGW